jgi:hypothetical protein
MDSLVLQTALGLVFVFAAFAALASVLTELVTRFLGLRGEYLLRGIRTLVDGTGQFSLGPRDLIRRKATEPSPGPGEDSNPVVTRIVSHPLIAGNADKAAMPANAGNAKLPNVQRRKLPSYVANRSFARALIDVAILDAAGQTTADKIKASLQSRSDLPDHLKKALLALLEDANGDIAVFRRNVEGWYDDHMARVSGWYKRHVRWITVGIAALLVLSFNLSAVEIARSLYTDQALRGAVVTQAADAAQCTDRTPAACLRELRAEIQQTRGVGLPIGWGTIPACAAPDASCNWFERRGLGDPADSGSDLATILLVALGWALMLLALLPGARFWFDALSRLGSLRSGGPKPRSS